MAEKEIIKSTQEQAVAAWVNFQLVLRMQELAKRLADQDINLAAAMKELHQFKAFIANPKHILGSPLQKHGEIAEHAQVHFENAADLIEGKVTRHTFDGVARLAKEDYLRNGKMVQSKFYLGPAGSLRAIATHLETYPTFLAEGGEYDIPKSQFEYLIKIYRNGENNTLSNTSDIKMFQAIREWEVENNIKFPDVVKPSRLDYDQVQLDTASATLQAEEDGIASRDQELRNKAHQDNKPTAQEGIKVTIVAAALEAGMAFALAVYQKRKAGKKLANFTAEDWGEIAKESGVGGLKGAFRGSTVYLLTNFTEIASPMANAMVTATLGMMAEANKLQQGTITTESFILASETLCLDVSISAVSSVAGQLAIPVPVIGAIIGNTAGMFMESIAKSYLSSEEEKIIAEYRLSMQKMDFKLSNEHKAFADGINAQLKKYDDLASLAFDSNPKIRLKSAKARALLLGAPSSRVLSDSKMDALFDSTNPIVL